MMHRRVASMVFAFAVGVVPRVAEAQPETALAETLFQEGKALLAKGSFADACPKLAESQRLDPGDGTLLALALCHEGEGKLAVAWSEYAAIANKSDARPDRVQRAKERLTEIEPKLARVAVVVPDATARSAPGLEIVRDGSGLGRAAWGTPSPVDAGAHVIEARAPGKRSVRIEVVAPRGRTVDVIIPALVPAVDVEPAPPHPTPAGPSIVAEPRASDASSSSSRSTFHVVAAGLGVVGLTAIGVGSYFGIRAVGLSRDAERGCAADGCSPESLRMNDEARSAARIANFTVAGGAAALGGGIVLFLLAPKASPRTVVTPYAGPGAAGASLATTF